MCDSVACLFSNDHYSGELRMIINKYRTLSVYYTVIKHESQMSVYYISRALFLFFVVVVVFLYIAYATKSWGNITGSRDKKPIHVVGRERSRTNFLYHFLLP